MHLVPSVRCESNKGYIFKAWVLAPMIPSLPYAQHVTDSAYLTLLDETSDPLTLGRLEVFEVFMEWDCKVVGYR